MGVRLFGQNLSTSAIYHLFFDRREWLRYDFHIESGASLLPTILNALSKPPLSSRCTLQIYPALSDPLRETGIIVAKAINLKPET